ncbi:MAG: hypothetical protein MMC33_009210 [Icmadophila ericetorum]|nr:hypothetical protein [Icmadophila ericetorum]
MTYKTFNCLFNAFQPFVTTRNSATSSPPSSMAGSPPSFPSKEVFLTPRSKIKAMMAALDDSDGEDVMTKSAGETKLDKVQLTPRTRVKNMLAKLGQSEGMDASNQSGEEDLAREGEDKEEEMEKDDDESVVVAPRGKLAARLQAQQVVDSPVEAGPKTSKADSAKEGVGSQISQPNEGGQASPSSRSDAQEEERPLGLTKNILARRKAPSEESSQGESENEATEPAGITRKFLTRPKASTAASDSNSSPFRAATKRKPPTKSLTGLASPKSREVTPQREPGSGLFLTPTPTKRSPLVEVSQNGDSDSDLPDDPQADPRFLALVAKKRAERQARNAEEEKKRAERYARLDDQSKKTSSKNRGVSAGSPEDSDDSAIDKKLTQQARPTRKASKKAIEEMNRETQRMARNLQLAHQAKTKKKITKDSLLARFNFGSSKFAEATIAMTNSSSTIGSPAPVSDGDVISEQTTPPTSPPKTDCEIPKLQPRKMDTSSQYEAVEELSRMYTDDELLSMEDMFTQAAKRIDKGKGVNKSLLNSAITEPTPRGGKGKGVDKSLLNSTLAEKQKKSKFSKPSIRVRPPPRPSNSDKRLLDSDSDLEIISAKKTGNKSRKLDIFDRLPAQKAVETHGLQTLRALAQLESPSKLKSKTKSKMTTREMQISLQQRARQQAAKERADKIKDLKDRGITIQTVEDRERNELEIEDMLEKARQEGDDLAKKEKKQAKEERLENGDVDALGDTSDEDEDYDDADIELSGSEEVQEDEEVEEDADEEMSDTDDEHDGGVLLDDGNNLIDGEALETEDDDDDSMVADDEVELDIPATHQTKRRGHVNRIVDDEDDEDAKLKSTDPIEISSPKNPFIPNFPNSSNSGIMGLSQAFAATMAESQSQGDNDYGAADDEQDSLAFLQGMPEPNFPMMNFVETDSFVPNSQPYPEAEVNLHLSQLETNPNNLPRDSEPPMTQLPWQPTPDQGFQITPAPRRFRSPSPTAPPSTIDTVIVEPESIETVIKKKGKLRRGTEMAAYSTHVEDSVTTDSRIYDVTGIVDVSAFDILKRGAEQKARLDEFDKKESRAKEMVEEQAEESEDEYQGLGGASDDGSGDEEDAEVLKMIDEAEVDVDERQLAAFHAGKERDDEEKVIQKIYKDIKSGALRRKRGAGVNSDLDDSSDEERRRVEAKRAKHAREMKALLNNSDVAKIADDKKKSAFLRTIEDQDDDDSVDFLEDEEPTQPSISVPDSQTLDSQDSPDIPDPGAEVTGTKRKRPLQESILDTINRTRPPPNPRRTHNNLKKPASFAETRKYISELVEGVDYVAETFIAGSSDSEAEFEDHENLIDSAIDAERENQAQAAANTTTSGMTNPRRTNNPIIDRLSLKRADSSSSTSTTTTISGGRLAFHNPSTSSSTLTSKIPSLLRRATTQNTDYNAQHGITTAPDRANNSSGSGGNDGVLKKGGSKKSSVNYFAREEERRKARAVKGDNIGEGKAWMKFANVGARGLGGLEGGAWE